nr:MAG TPA_asm: hypothetical protein [Caudoviricetes sp.]
MKASRWRRISMPAPPLPTGLPVSCRAGSLIWPIRWR